MEEADSVHKQIFTIARDNADGGGTGDHCSVLINSMTLLMEDGENVFDRRCSF